jgi:acyl-CoA reductase-like NAD-dependent aldehyde dehydrogenase
VCVAASRVIVQNSIKDALIEKVITYAKSYKVGNLLDLNNSIGAIANFAQLNVIEAKVNQGKNEGATLLLGGERVNIESGGCYYAPTIFSDVTPDMSIAKEEVFGPVLAILGFDTIEEAITIANNTVYGLSSVV